jgi:chromosome partitioning protein
MISILVANTKGGCGKTTISTNLAAAFAAAGHPTALADADRQRSSLAWAGVRPGTAAPIMALDWVEELTMKRRHVLELVKEADVIIVPVLPSAFDQTSTAAFLDRLHELKSIRRNRKPVGILRNRVRPRTKAAARLLRFLDRLEHQDLGGLPDRTIYNEVAADGLSIFDLPDRRAQALRADWAGLLNYVNTID